MKKRIAVILSIMLCSITASCGDEANNSVNNAETDSKISESVVINETDEEAEKAKEINEDFLKGQKHLEKNDFEFAIGDFKKVPEDSPEYAEAQVLLEQAYQGYIDQSIQSANNLVEIQSFDTAEETLEKAIEYIGENSDLQAKYDEVIGLHVAYVLENINNYSLEDKYNEAINYFKDNLKIVEESEELQNKYEEVKQIYVTEKIAEADELIAKGDYDGAIGKLQIGLTYVENSTELKDKMSDTEYHKPVSLCDFTFTNSRNFDQITIDRGAEEDSIGNVYAPGNCYLSYWERYSGNSFTEIYLGKKYSKITGTVAPHKNCNSDGTSRIEIYADERLVYSQKVERKTIAFDFNVDLGDCEWLKIQNVPVDNSDATIICYDFKLSR